MENIEILGYNAERLLFILYFIGFIAYLQMNFGLFNQEFVTIAVTLIVTIVTSIIASVITTYFLQVVFNLYYPEYI